MGDFLDTGGAFNNTCYDTMCEALARHGGDYTIIRWIRATLEGRATTINDYSVRVAVSRGFPQGEYCHRFCGAL